MLLFQRLGSSSLYVGNPSGSDPGNHLGEILLILPEQSSQLAPTMTLEEAWDFQHPSGGAGYILFLDAHSDFGDMNALGADAASAFASRLHQLLPRYVRNHHLSLGWVSGTLAMPRLQTLSMVRINGAVRTQNVPQVVRFLQLEIMVLPGTPFEYDPDNGFRLLNTPYLAPPGGDPRDELPTSHHMYIRAGAPYDMDKIGEAIDIALLGPDRGSLQFEVIDLTAFDIDVGKLDTSICYVVPEAEMPEPYPPREQIMRFPLLNLEPTRSGKSTSITLAATLYPATQAASIFRFRNANGDNGQLESYFRTFNGYPVHLVPQDDAGLVFSRIPNPGVYPSRAAEVDRHYNLVPTGRFAMYVDEPFPDGDSYHRLMGGNSGTEYISFVNGDLLCFFPEQPAYAPGFEFTADGTARRIQQNGGTLLDPTYRTSWLSVTGPSGPNGHIHYFSQPDDAALHGQETTDYLQYVEVETASLKDPSEIHCFPMAPLSGVVAPDERVSAFMTMEKYLLFEQKTLNPARKTRITYVAGEMPSVTRSLLQTPAPRYTTTPQGMLVTVAGSDWQQLTLAKDDTPFTPNYLRFADISDEFQDALSASRLFLVATDPQALMEQGGQFVDNLLRVQGWPFRFDIGEAPNGLPQEDSGPNSVNNVLIFKFVNKPLSELAEDSLLWSRPDDFNRGETDRIRDWLVEFIEDVRTTIDEADEEDDVSGYEHLVTILDNPNWHGVLGLNVTVPPDLLPCEVQPLLAGIRDMPAFKAHHVGFSIGKVTPDARDIERSSIFGLIDYEDSPVITPGLGEDFFYEFIVLKLLVKFENSEIADFASDIRIVMLRLFDENTYAQPGNWNYIDLEGSYKMESGKPSYSFSTPFVFGPKAFTVYSKGKGVLPLVNSVEITKAELVSDTCVLPNSTSRTSRAAFKYSGSIDFSSMVEFDFFSFEKMKFTNLLLNMEFEIPLDHVPERYLPTYKFSPGDLRVDVGLSKLRENSLLANFPLKLESFHYNEAGINFAEMGYFEVPTFVPGWNGAKKPKYGLAFTLDLGPLSSLLKKGGPKGAIQILAAWGPTIDESDPDYEEGDEGGDVSFGITLGKGANGKKEIGIEGVFIVSLSDFGFQKIATDLDSDGVEDYVYCLYLSNAYLKILGTQLPPGGNFSLVLFVPFNGKSDKVSLANLGWFVSYERGEGESASASTGAVGVSVTITPAGPIDQGRMVRIKVKVTTGTFNMMVNATVRTEVLATDDSPPTGVTGKPLPPTPPSSTQQISVSAGEAEFDFEWPATQSGKFKVKAYVTTTGEGNAESGVGESQSFTVRSVSGGEPSGGAKDSDIIHLDYLGVGNRVTVPLNETEAEILEITSVEKMIDTMKAKMPIRGSGTNATSTAKQLTAIYRPNGGLLIGFDVTLFNVIRLAAVFAQELQIYGGLIGFTDDAPDFISNFKFQVLYKPVTDDIGVFHILLQLPDYLRRWDIGKGTLTLPIIGIDIYTNGNFKLDLGFPYEWDFSRSLSFEIIIWLVKIPIPLVWSVGFYFSYLTGKTSLLVPVLTEPTDNRPESQYPMFDPVFEAGLGIRFGLGREMNYGPLKAGATISLVAMLEGAMAWYWPNGRSGAGSPDLTRFPDWFRVSGKAGLIGKIYGHVDFKIIKASVNIELQAIFHFVFETYRDIRFGITMSVSVSASVSFGLFSISFSFKASFTFEFSIPNPMGDPPWLEYLESVSAPIERSLLQVNSDPISWATVPGETWFESLPQSLRFTMVVGITSGQDDAQPNPGPRAHAVALFATEMEDARRIVTAATRWAIASFLNGNFATNATLTLQQLEELDSRLNPQPDANSVIGNPDQLIPYETLRAFLFTTFPTRGTVQPATGADLAIFPAFPETTLEWGTSGQLNPERNLDEYNRPPDGYLDDLAAYFDLLKVDVLDKSDLEPVRSLLQTGTQSMAELVFEDFFEMIIKAGVSQVVEWARANPFLQPSQSNPNPTVSVIEIQDALNSQAPGNDLSPVDTVIRMANRYFAHGLRIPRRFDGNPPDYEALSQTAEGLYALTGQQLPIENMSFEWQVWANVSPQGMNLNFNYQATEEDYYRALSYANPNATLYSGLNAPTVLPPLASEDRMFAFRSRLSYDNGFIYPMSDVMVNRLLERANEPSFPQMTQFNDGGTQLETWNSNWALMVPFTAKRVYRTVDTTVTATDEGGADHTFEGRQDQPIPNTYEIGGTDERTREIISAYLAGTATSSEISLFYRMRGQDSILHPLPFATAGIQKVNLSTVSAPQSTQLQQLVPAHEGFSADFHSSQAKPLLRLIWEASIVNASGFYMYFDNNSAGPDGSSLPEAAFDSADGRADLVLLVSINGSAAGANVLQVKDPNFVEVDLYAKVAQEYSYSPVLAQGAVGFELLRERPPDTPIGEPMSEERFAGDLSKLYSLLSYQIIDPNGSSPFNQSIHGLPVGPQVFEDDPDTWVYRHGIKVFRYLKNPQPGVSPRYSAVGQTVTLGFEFLDVFGNRLVLAPGSEELAMLPIPVRYSDPLIAAGTWSGIGLGYEFTANGQLHVVLSFDADSYTNDDAVVAGPGSDAGQANEYEGRREAALTSYRQVLEQLSGPGVTISFGTTVAPGMGRTNEVETVKSFVQQIINFLDRTVQSAPPAPITFTASVDKGLRDAQPLDIFPIRVDFSISRAEHLIAEMDGRPASDFLPEIREAVTWVPAFAVTEAVDFGPAPPESDEQAYAEWLNNRQSMAYEPFAHDFEVAFPEFKVATGLGEDGPHTLWAVRMSANQGLWFNTQGAPSFFAPPPLSQVLRTRSEVPVREAYWGPDGGPEDNTTLVGFTDIDMDIWGREFLGAVDRFLSPEMAVAARRIADGDGPGPYGRIVAAKEKIADAIAKRVTWVVEPAPSSPAMTEEAQEQYRQRMLVKLSSAYDVETAVVFPMNTAGPGSNAPRAYGSLLAERPGGAVQDDADPESGYAFAPAKVELAGGTRYLPAMFSSGRTHSHAAVTLDIQYAVTHIEHDIQQEQDGYQASSWLTLVLPDRKVNLNRVDIPVALREYPRKPELVSQRAVPAVNPDDVTTIQEAKGWNYHYTMLQPAVPHDTTFSRVDFNVADPDPNRSLLQAELDLFDWLARFHWEYPRSIAVHINKLSDGAKAFLPTPPDDVVNAIDWFANIVEGVADTWESWDPVNNARDLQQLGDALLPYSWEYEFEEFLNGDEALIRMLARAYDHPQVQVPTVSVALVDGTMVEATRSAGPDGAHDFTYPWTEPELPEDRPRVFKLQNLDVLNTENAWGSIRLARNLKLNSPDYAPSRGRQTNPAFVYQTPEARFVNKVTPLLDTIVPVVLPGGGPKSLDAHLRQMFEELFATAGDQQFDRLLKLGVRYAYDVRGLRGEPSVAKGPDQLGEYISYMPVVQRMPFKIKPDATGINNLSAELAAEMQAWFNRIRPEQAHAYYEFDVSIFAALSVTDLPVLRIRRIWLGLERIS